MLLTSTKTHTKYSKQTLASKIWIMLLIVPGITGCQSQKEKSAGIVLTPVAAETVVEKNFSQYGDYTGLLKSEKVATIKAETSGRVININSQEGEEVPTGKMIMVLDDKEQIANLREAEAFLKEKSETYLRRTRTPEAYSRETIENLYRETQQAKQKVEAARAQLEYKYIKAPISGTLGDIIPEVGDYVEENQEIAVITNNKLLELRLDIPSTEAYKIKKGQSVKITAEGKPPIQKEGTLSFIAANIKPDRQSVLVKASFNNQNNTLRTGQVVSARLVYETQKQLSVPAQAVIMIANQAFVYKIVNKEAALKLIGNGQDADPALIKKINGFPKNTLVTVETPIKLGPLTQDSYPLIKGLESGSQVATSQTRFLATGTAVNIKSGE